MFGGDVFPLDDVGVDWLAGGVDLGGGEFDFHWALAFFLEEDEGAAVGEGGAEFVVVFFPEGGDGPVGVAVEDGGLGLHAFESDA